MVSRNDLPNKVFKKTSHRIILLSYWEERPTSVEYINGFNPPSGVTLILRIEVVGGVYNILVVLKYCIPGVLTLVVSLATVMLFVMSVKVIVKSPVVSLDGIKVTAKNDISNPALTFTSYTNVAIVDKNVLELKLNV